MAKKQLPKRDITLTNEEIEELKEAKESGKLDEREDEEYYPTTYLHRRKKSMVEKLDNLEVLEELFINEQKARMNSKYTIMHYERTFKKIYQFLTYEVVEDDIESMNMVLDAYPDLSVNEAFYQYGKTLEIASLELDDIQKKFGEYLMDEDGVSEQTVISYFRDFRAIMYYAMEQGWIEQYKIKIPDREADIKNCYTNAEIERLLRKPNEDNFTEYRNWVIINYLLSTGHRVQTLINIKVGDIDFDEGYININTQKSKKTARIGLIKKLLIILKEYVSYYRTDEDGEPLYDERLFCNRYGEPMTDGGLKTAIRSYNLSRGVTKTSVHLFRHTFAKNWIISGGDIVSLQKILGQSSLKMVQRYANLYSRDVKDKAEEHAILAQTRTRSGRTLKKQPLTRRKV